MAESNNPNQEDGKNKVQIPEESKTLRKVQPPTQDSTAAASINNDDDDAYEEDKSEQFQVDKKIIDQRNSNIPIQNPDLDDFKELLNQTAAQIGLN